ncbi:hypothetical protein Mapa_004637 [Marchantia paleacea]|nr:hypothetical protein Mapa_004637 [Marchantia paleacea]
METTNESPTITVLRRDVEDIKDCLVQLSAKQESICSSDILQACSRVDGEAKCCNSEAKRVLTEKQDQMSFLLKFVLNKLEHILPTAASTGQVESTSGLKRSRPLTPLRVCRPSGAAFLADSGPGGNGVSGVTGAEDTPPTSPGPNKFYKVGTDSKAPGHRLYMPTATIGKLSVEPAGSASIAVGSNNFGTGVSSKPVVNTLGIKSPKKRPTRSRRDRNRQRNKQSEAPVAIQRLKPGEQGKIPDDGYLWRKYGNKPIKTASYKRGYYKCRHFKEMKCNATKIVQQTNSDPSVFHVTYKDTHTCKQAPQHGGAAKGVNHSADTENVSLADQISRVGDMPCETLDYEPAGLEWPASPDNSSASEDLFPQSEEEGVESSRLVEQHALLDFADDLGPELSQDLSGANLLQQVQDSSLGSLDVSQVQNWQQVTTSPEKLKLHPGKMHPGLDQLEMDQLDVVNMEEIVLNASQGCNWNFEFSDIAFWQPDLVDVQSCFQPGD